ncbi:hypothetical protein [Sulfuritalea hydrogenivorans]|jgi:hypothetical protein|uniref:Lipoprotein n=1 Tax=Sulfuritalea hydrogenivorans sk43H TaxID=1223802 RepID=W0SI34_9PROT|nr:hypothetical protein [Sulfuritalea hydrogenivorans]BAO30570.1 hypothetical protein SUTH_02791 [Sulfuritalea hydrogenivorans sk43H]
MKKLLVVGIVSSVFSAGAFAAACTATAAAGAQAAAAGTGNATTASTAGEYCVCDGGTAFKNTVNGGSGTVLLTPVFAKTGFDVQCSANTVVSYNEVSGNLFAVGGGSRKGNQSVAGTSNGGAVTAAAKCSGTNDACTGANVSTALGNAVTAAGSN